MFELTDVKHHIQKYILSTLLRRKYARFRDMRPPRTDTNLYSYHLKILMKLGYVEKHNEGYTLSAKGLAYVDRVNAASVKVREQPKIITMLLVQDGYGNVLMLRRDKQPYIDTWTLPYGKMHLDDSSVSLAARRESVEKLNFEPKHIRHAGSCYIRVYLGGELVTMTLAHIARFETDDISSTDNLQWFSPLEVLKLDTGPAVNEIIARAFFGDDFFFEEFEVSVA